MSLHGGCVLVLKLEYWNNFLLIERKTEEDGGGFEGSKGEGGWGRLGI